MAKLSKQKIKAHNEAEKLLKKDTLTFDEKLFVFENWQEGANNINSEAGAFFTPFGLARDMNLEISGNKIVDLCAGIGMLSFVAYHLGGIKDITCIELNHNYYSVGKKLLPEANWINGSIFDINVINSLPRFNTAISNPPFGKIKTGIDEIKNQLKYKGSEFDLMTIEIASMIADKCTFILPQMSTPFRYSGSSDGFQDLREKQGCYNLGGQDLPKKVDKFIKETGFDFDFNVGIDTSAYVYDWKGVSPICEIINIEFDEVETPTQQTLF